MKVRFSAKYRARLSEKLMELGNIAGGALVFGQFLSKERFSFATLIGGVIVVVIFYFVSYIISS